MKFSDLCKAPKLLVRRATAEAMIEHALVLDLFVRANWIQPIETGSGRVELYRVKDLEECAERLAREGYATLEAEAEEGAKAASKRDKSGRRCA